METRNRLAQEKADAPLRPLDNVLIPVKLSGIELLISFP